MTEEVPASVVPMLSKAIADAKDALKPADEKAVTVLLDRLFLTLPRPTTRDRVTGRPMPDLGALAIWNREFSRYPLDLLDAAVDEVIRTHKWETVPKVAQIVEQVRPELIRRQDWLRKLETAGFKARMTTRRQSSSASSGAPAKKGPMPERLERLVADTIASMRAAGEEDAANEATRADSLARAGYEREAL